MFTNKYALISINTLKLIIEYYGLYFKWVIPTRAKVIPNLSSDTNCNDPKIHTPSVITILPKSTQVVQKYEPFGLKKKR